MNHQISYRAAISRWRKMSQFEIKEDLESLAKHRNEAEEKIAILSALFSENRLNEYATAQKLGKSVQELGNFPEENH